MNTKSVCQISDCDCGPYFFFSSLFFIVVFSHCKKFIVLTLVVIVEFIEHENEINSLRNCFGRMVEATVFNLHIPSKLNNTLGNRRNKLLNITEPFLPIFGFYYLHYGCCCFSFIVHHCFHMMFFH